MQNYFDHNDESEQEESVVLPDHVLALILSMLTTPDLLKAMVTNSSFPF